MSVSGQLGERREVQLAQGTIRYRERGAGPPVVFLHGLLVNGDLWRKVVPPLAGDFRCIAPDLPLGSHEVPMRPDADLSPTGVAGLVADFLEALDLHDVTLVANDSGGAITQILLTRRPARVARAVLTNCDCFEVFPPKMFAYLSVVSRIPGAMNLLAQSMRIPGAARMPFAFGRLMREMPERAVLDSWAGPAMSSSEVRRDTAKFMRGIDSALTLEAATRFGSVRQPVLVAWGDADPFFELELGRRLATALPHGKLEVVRGARTFVSEDEPDRLAWLIAAFVREAEPAVAAS
jgi:pimeloyl-ACP methyl ester carboxylesterase